MPRLCEDPASAQECRARSGRGRRRQPRTRSAVAGGRIPARQRQPVPARLLRPAMAKTATAALRKLPSVDEVLRAAAAAGAIERFGRSAVVSAVRRVLAESRARGAVPDRPDEVIAAAQLVL